MRSILNDKVKIILEVLLVPVIIYFSGVFALATFNAGTFLGTFLRYIYYYVVC